MVGLKEAEKEILDELTVQERQQEFNIPTILGPPGTGKTAICGGIAAKLGRHLVVTNTGDSEDPTDTTGTPVPESFVRENALLTDLQRSDMVETSVREGDTRMEAEQKVSRIVWSLNHNAYLACTRPTLQLFDDVDKISPAVMKGLIGLFGTRRYRDFSLHPKTLLMCAGNRVGDDILAAELSESLLGRITVIEVEPTFEDFAEYGVSTGEISEEVIGFLAANREHLFMPIKEGQYANPSPRSWKQVSSHWEYLKERGRVSAKAKARVVERKCGGASAKDWLAWDKVLSKVDVQQLLTTGLSPATEQDRMFLFAAVFAVSREIRNAKTISKKWTGLVPLTRDLPAEIRLALLVQLPAKTRTKLFEIYGEPLSDYFLDVAI